MTKPYRTSPRLKDYDYARNGAYFITICTQNRACLFGSVREGEMYLNPAGEMLGEWWRKLPEKFSTVETDALVIMPNHVHGILVLFEEPDTGAHVGAPLQEVDQPEEHIPSESAVPTAASLSTIIQWFKSMTTNGYMHGVKEQGWPRFAGKLWQRSYYDHIIRDEVDLKYIQRYILSNPARWEQDSENRHMRS
ncbi:MAG: transposase [bacterium]|nr:transposase [bacterium]